MSETKSPLITTDQKAQIERAVELYAEKIRPTEIALRLNQEFGVSNITPHCKIMREAKKHYFMSQEIFSKEVYMKESLAEYEDIKDRANDVADLKEGLKIKLTALRDRNELIGLQKAGVNIEINFESKNLSDDEFLNAMNVEVKDVTPIDIPSEDK